MIPVSNGRYLGICAPGRSHGPLQGDSDTCDPMLPPRESVRYAQQQRQMCQELKVLEANVRIWSSARDVARTLNVYSTIVPRYDAAYILQMLAISRPGWIASGNEDLSFPYVIEMFVLCSPEGFLLYLNQLQLL